jgi:superfamily II DNA or RNA helicase
MADLSLSFDRGTLRVDGDVDGISDLVRFDERTGFHRAAAQQYSVLVDRARARGLRLHNAVAPAFQSRRDPGPVLALRPYQEQALTAFDTFGRRGIVALPTGSGKTRVACAAMARSGSRALVLVPTRALLEQWASILKRQFGDPIGIVGDGMKQVEAITVMTFESGYRCLDRFGDRFEMLVVDEVHHFASGLRAEALEMCVAPIRLGLSATPPFPGSPGAARLRDLVGPVVFELEIADLAGRDLAPLEVLRIHVALNPDERQRYERELEAFSRLRREIVRTNPNADWITCVRAIARMPAGSQVLAGMRRATALASFPAAKAAAVRELLVRHRGDRALLFTASAEDAYAIGEEALVPVITAEVARPEREAILLAFRERRVRAICSARVLNEGVDVPEANVAIIVAGAMGAREHIQRIGRILRPSSDKNGDKRAVAYELITMDSLDEARTRARRRRFAPGQASQHFGL